MREKFKKIVSVATSVLMVGSTIGFAMAAGGGFPTPFVENNEADYAIVVGAGAAASDMTGAGSINTYLNTFYSVDSEGSDSSTIYTGDFSDAVGVTEDEIELGSSITPQIKASLTDSKIPTLLDTEISWDDGIDSKRYDVHEEINILDDGMVLKTTLDNDELEDDVVLENNRALEYKFVFDDVLTISQIGKDEADSLYLTILGKEYEILKMSDHSITISFSDEKVVKTGDKVTSDGVTLTIGDIFLGSVEVNNVLIKEGETRTVNSIEVYIDTIAYHSHINLPSKAIIKVGSDISQTISSGDEYIEDDETWIWSIENLGNVDGYIGVKYDIKSVGFDEDEEEENAITVGGQYALPENYGAVVFEGLTSVDYEDFELFFDDRDLYDGLPQGDRSVEVYKPYDDWDVAILEGENDDSITLTLSDGTIVETDSIYLRYVPEVVDGDTIILDANVELYFKDIDGDIDDDHEGRIQFAGEATGIKIVVGDNEMVVTFDETSLTFTKEGESIEIDLEDVAGSFKQLGSDDENAETTDVVVVEGETTFKIGTRENDVLTHYGVIVVDPENNADSDRVLLSIPDTQVYAKVSVVGQGMSVEETDTETDEEVPELGGIVILDSEIGAHSNKNFVLVGGSCINAETAKYLGGKSCGADFTSKTGVIAGQYLIQSFISQTDATKIAVVVAGFHGEDTTKGISDFIASETDFGVVGTKIIG